MKYLVTTSLLLSLMYVSPVFADSYAQTAEKAIKVGGYAGSFYDCATNPTVEQCAKSAAKAAIDVAAVPTAVGIVSISGATATTGTVISTLSGAPAVSASMYVIGAPVVAVLGITASPVWVGAIIVGGVATGVGWVLFD